MTLKFANEIMPKPKGWKIPLWFKFFFLSFILLGGISLIFLMRDAYKDGEVTGKIVSFSKRGVLFKTYEGILLTDSEVEANGDKLANGTNWEFTVPKDNAPAINALEEAVPEERLKIKFREKYFRFFWQADSRHVVQKVERL